MTAAAWSKARIEAANGTPLTTPWDAYAWPTFWLPETTALDTPAPDAATEPTPIWDAALAAHLAAGGTHPIPFAARVCGTCGATDKAPCVTPSGKVLRHFHKARG